MKTKHLIASALALSVSHGAMAFEKPEVVVAASETPAQSIKAVEFGTVPDSNMEKHNSHKLDLTPTHIGLGYVASSDGKSSTGFSFEAGHRISEVEFGAAYHSIQNLDLGGLATDNAAKIELSMMAPLVRNDEFQITYGVNYKHSTFDEQDAHNDSFFFALESKAVLADSLVATFGAEYEAMGDEIMIAGSKYDVHDDVTYNVGLDYHISEKFVFGGELSYGSAIDKTFMVSANYLF